MSNPTSQSRLSVDLGAGKKLVTSRSVRQNPPRLQHSPSLPNIWQVFFLTLRRRILNVPRKVSSPFWSTPLPNNF